MGELLGNPEWLVLIGFVVGGLAGQSAWPGQRG
jgi:hypothetical protein